MKKRKDILFQKKDWVDIAMLIYPVENSQICIHGVNRKGLYFPVS